MESEEERERKSKRAAKKVKVEGESGDEGVEPKKKKRSGGKLKKAVDQDVDNEQLFSDDEVDSKPAKKVWTVRSSLTKEVLSLSTSVSRKSESSEMMMTRKLLEDHAKSNSM
jgi:hypothetical protein